MQRFQPVIAGSELGNGFSELNDPLEQLNRFIEQQTMRDAGDDEAMMLDIDFIEMLEYGMPPACVEEERRAHVMLVPIAIFSFKDKAVSRKYRPLYSEVPVCFEAAASIIEHRACSKEWP